MALAAAFLPYYLAPPATLPALLRFPSPSALPGDGASGGSATRPAAVRPHLEGEGADFVIGCVADTLSKDIRTGAGLLRYLAALSALRGAPCLALLRTATRLRLQVGRRVQALRLAEGRSVAHAVAAAGDETQRFS